MDALVDKVFTVGMMVVLVGVSQTWSGIAALLVILILCREFLVTGLRLLAAQRGVVLAAERLGKLKTVVQMAAIGIGLCADHNLIYLVLDTFTSLTTKLDASVIDTILAIEKVILFISLILLLLATILTVISGVSYFIKYRHLFTEETKTPEASDSPSA